MNLYTIVPWWMLYTFIIFCLWVMYEICCIKYLLFKLTAFWWHLNPYLIDICIISDCFNSWYVVSIATNLLWWFLTWWPWIDLSIMWPWTLLKRMLLLMKNHCFLISFFDLVFSLSNQSLQIMLWTSDFNPSPWHCNHMTFRLTLKFIIKGWLLLHMDMLIRHYFPEYLNSEAWNFLIWGQ